MPQPRTKFIHEQYPYSMYQLVRQTKPVFYSQRYKAWGVFRYEGVKQVFTDYNTFASNFARQERPPLLVADPPRHQHLRALVSQAFTPRRIAQFEPAIAEVVHKIWDRVTPAGEMDLFQEMAYPLPAITIARMLGVSEQDNPRLMTWLDEFVGQEAGGLEYPAPHPAMAAYFSDLVQVRIREPQDDLTSHLLRAEVEGEHLDLEEVVNFCTILFISGRLTTAHLIANVLLCLDQHPEAVEELRARRELLPSAIEEVLRYHPPVQAMNRVAVKDCVIGGQHIRAGEMVIPWIGSANHDELQFPDPDHFNITRAPNKHLSFGHGIHFCLGAPLARLEARIVLESMLERFSEVRLVSMPPSEAWKNAAEHGGKRRLPIVFKTKI